jgi:dolichyl-phosphate beta-glucosyltransferase
MGRVFNALVRQALLPGLQDTQCGFKLFSAQAVEAIMPLTTLEGWALDLEILYIARVQGWRIQEVPIEWHYGAESRVSAMRDPWHMVADLWRIRSNARRGLYNARDNAARAEVPARPEEG